MPFICTLVEQESIIFVHNIFFLKTKNTLIFTFVETESIIFVHNIFFLKI
jgi:hypothetical protein